MSPVENDYFDDTVCDYIPTQEEIIAFAKDKAGYSSPVLSTSKPIEELNGQLVLIEGNNVTVVKYDLPWALLSSIKRTMVNNGYKSKNLFLKRLLWKKN